MEGLKSGILSYLEREKQRKVEEGRVPPHTHYSELIEAVRVALNELYKEGKIKVGKALNDKYIEV